MSGSITGRQFLNVQSGGDDSTRDDGASGHRLNSGPRTKRTLIESACAACRRRKSRVGCQGVLCVSPANMIRSATEHGKLADESQVIKKSFAYE